MNLPSCCEEARGKVRFNPRHLWSEHDDDRHYVDPDGWEAHVASCKQCRGETNDEP